MTKKVKKPDAINKVVDYFLENIDNPQDLFKGKTIFQEFTRKLTERMLNAEIKDHLETDDNYNKRNGRKKPLLLKMVQSQLMYQEIEPVLLNQ